VRVVEEFGVSGVSGVSGEEMGSCSWAEGRERRTGGSTR
jgi:hypothetical protein